MDDFCGCIYRVQPVVRNYDWGKSAESSLVYRLFTHGICPLPSLDGKNSDNRCYAELWIGDHDAAPCRVFPCKRRHFDDDATNASSLDNGDVVAYPSPKADHSDSTANTIDKVDNLRLSSTYKSMGRQLFGHELEGPSILLKVLSIAKPLSLQIHPDRESASTMYQAKHANIVDSRAKPEMCLALGQFRFMCGLRPLSEIVLYADRYSPFSRLVGDGILSRLRAGVDGPDGSVYLSLCRRLLLSKHDAAIIDELVALVKARIVRDLSEEVFLVLSDMHGNDICTCFAFILNCVELQAGESCFIPPNTLHSYIGSGDCVELMNNSDNVIRCGLTTKAVDAEAVIYLLEVEHSKGHRFPQMLHMIHPEVVSPFVKKYRPIHETCNFALWSFVVPGNTHVSHCFSNVNQAFIGVVLDTNTSVTIGACSESAQLHGGAADEMHYVSLELGDGFMMYPNTILDVTNNGFTDFVLYLGTEVNSTC